MPVKKRKKISSYSWMKRKKGNIIEPWGKKADLKKIRAQQAKNVKRIKATKKKKK